MREYEVRIGPSAIAQILEAVQYVRDELCMPQAAEELFEELELRITGLPYMPSRYHKVDVEPFQSAGVRRMNVRKCSVFYVVDNQKQVVNVFAVLYGSPTNQRLRRAFEGLKP